MNSPARIGFENSGPNQYLFCYATNTSGEQPEASGGVIAVATDNGQGGLSFQCLPDSNAVVKVHCDFGADSAIRDPWGPSPGNTADAALYFNGAHAIARETGVEVGEPNEGGTCAWVGGSLVLASCPLVFVSATRSTWGPVAVSGTGDANGTVAASGTGNANGTIAVSGSGSSFGGLLGLSGTGSAGGGIAASALGPASGTVGAVSGEAAPATTRAVEAELIRAAVGFLALKNELLTAADSVVFDSVTAGTPAKTYSRVLTGHVPNLRALHDELAGGSFFVDEFYWDVLDTSVVGTAEQTDVRMQVYEAYRITSSMTGRSETVEKALSYTFSFAYIPSSSWEMVSAAQQMPDENEHDNGWAPIPANPADSMSDSDPVGEVLPDEAEELARQDPLLLLPDIQFPMTSSANPQIWCVWCGSRRKINRQKMVEYAAAYHGEGAGNYNPAYRNFDPTDCNNFVSQALFAGGWTMEFGHKYSTGAWWYNFQPGRSQSRTWTSTTHLFTYFHHSRRGRLVKYWSDLRDGDVVFADWDRDSSVDHSMIVVGTDPSEPGIKLLSQHTNDRAAKKRTELPKDGHYYGWHLAEEFRSTQ
ncbi:MAG TPA: amidase domain-containing protein [Actinomycetota bacterium]|nr:amidase domain-containing protein [Actinomycetota bacterium]